MTVQRAIQDIPATPSRPHLTRTRPPQISIALSTDDKEDRGLTPSLASSLGDAGRKRRGVDVAVACVCGRGWFADHEFVERDAVGGDLEEGRFGPD